MAATPGSARGETEGDRVVHSLASERRGAARPRGDLAPDVGCRLGATCAHVGNRLQRAMLDSAASHLAVLFGNVACPMSARSIPRRLALPLSWLRSQLASAMFWNGLAGLCARGLPVIGMLIAARILGREAFGELGIVYQTIMTLEVFAVAGLGTTATTFVAHWLHTQPERVGRIMVLSYGFTIFAGSLFALGFFTGAEWIAAAVLAAPTLADELRLGGVLAFLSALAAVQNGMLMGFKAFRDMAVANSLGGAASAALICLGAYAAGVAGALYGLGIALTLRALINYLLIRRGMRRHAVRLAFPRAEVPLLWRFSLPSVLTMALWTLATWSASVLLVRQPGGMAEMGLLAAANQWFSALMFVPGVLTQVLLPTYAERVAGNRRLEASSLAARSSLAVLLGMALFVIPMVLLSHWIAGLYGPEFRSGAAVFAALFVTAAIAAPYGALGNYLVAEERMWIRFHINLLWAIVLLAGAALLIERGAIGVALATLTAYVIRTALITCAYWRLRGHLGEDLRRKVAPSQVRR
jgi:O-antigen/teichoic acid export membrane protein